MDRIKKILTRVKDLPIKWKNKVINKVENSKNLRIGLFATALSIASFVVAIVISYVAMREYGKNSLYGDVAGQSMDFEQSATDEELDIDMGEMGGEDSSQNTTDIVQNDEESTSLTTSKGENATGETTTDETTTGNIVQADDNVQYDVTLNGEKYKYNEDILTFLILGIDKNEKVTPAKDGISGGQSDAIYLLVMNPHTKKIDLITVHRDTIARLWIYDRDGSFLKTGKAQICLQHGYGDGMELSNERAKKAVSTLFYNLPIHSVTSVNMGAIGKLNDAIGGVTLEALESFSFNGVSFTAGETVTLKGEAAYAYTKYRDTSQHFTASKRLERQKQYLSKAIEQGMVAVKKDVTTLVDIYGIIKDYVVTDLSIDEMTYLATESLDYSFGQIYTPAGTIDTSRTYERYYLDTEEFEKMIINIFYEKVN